MKFSNHAIIRSKQRGIPTILMDLILKYGTEVNKPGGAIELVLTKKDRDELISSIKNVMHLVEKTKNKAILVDSDMNSVITAYHKN